MNAVGKRSGASAAHHQRQYYDNFLKTTLSSSNGHWLQSAGLQHLQSTNPPPQDFGFYGGQGSRMYKNPQRTFSGSKDLFAEPLTPPGSMRGQRRNGGDDANEFSPGLLDLHAFDTELIHEGHQQLISVDGVHRLHIFIFFLACFHILYSAITMLLGRMKLHTWKNWEEEAAAQTDQSHDHAKFRLAHETSFVRDHSSVWTKNPILFYLMPSPAMVDAPMYRSSRGRSFDHSEPYYGASKQSSRARGVPENNTLKPFITDKEKASRARGVSDFEILYFS